MSNYHIPVMLKECLNYLSIDPSGVYVDCTMGGGGHFISISNLLEDGIAIGVDRDEEAIREVSEKLKNSDKRIIIERTPFSKFGEILTKHGIDTVDGILMDLGVSSHQFDAGERGFSYRADAELDMRMDNRSDVTAEIVINDYSENELITILRDYGEVKNPARMAKTIIKARNNKRISTTGDFVDLLNEEYGNLKNSVLSKVFQAIRIEVNQELEELKNALKSSVEYLKEGGRLVIMSYHSLEDRIVKQFYRDMAKDCICPPHLPMCNCSVVPKLKVITRKPVVASDDEIKLNVRARSAKLRVAERV